jgi:serine/threonine protein kinase
VRHSDGSDQNVYVLKRLKNPERLARFEKEIEVLTKLSHPGIVRIIETSKKEPFFVAEYCEKGDLTKVNLSSKTLLEKLLMYREICDAVAAAHRAGIVHRDLKPQNILIRGDGSVAVGDFGLCLDLNDLEERLTSSSEAVGARHYIAPELEDGRVVDPKPSCDCYSLGKLLYYIFGGRSFARERHRDTAYDLRATDDDIYLFFVYELLDKAIIANPANRYRNAEELLAALDGAILRIKLDAHVLNIHLPQHCLYCVSGRYIPMTGVDSPHELRLVCRDCGNVQVFAGRRTWRRQ